MGRLADLTLAIAPRWVAKREQARVFAMHYRAARLNERSDSLRPSRADADTASRDRARITAYMRDLIRNSPFATRGQSVITNNVVGDGIIPKIDLRGITSDKLKARLRAKTLSLIEDHLDTVAIDMHGLQNLYGLQRLAMNAIVDSGEVLIRRHLVADQQGRSRLKLEVLEGDYLDTMRWGQLSGGGSIEEGIEYSAQGQRVAYWLFTQHPGGQWQRGRSIVQSERVAVDDIIHVFRQDRPGQTRGVSWFAPVAEKLMSFDDYEDAQMMRQKIAACFTAFRRLGTTGEAEKVELGGKLEPGSIMDIGPDDEMIFGNPPDVTGYDEFTDKVLRASAMGLGITYESLTGDLTGVNFSSARIGRLDMDRNISAWQWLMLVPMLLQPLSRWILDDWIDHDEWLLEVPNIDKVLRLTWVPPVRILVDPAREVTALKEMVRAGFQSRQGVVRQLGVDPERLQQEQLQDKEEADALGLIFDSDPRSDVARLGKDSNPATFDEETRNGAS